MEKYCIVVHNSDKVKDVFSGGTRGEILDKLKKSKYWSDIKERVQEENESTSSIRMNHITSLYHDGDSEDGYTLILMK